ncbi:VanZ family protein [Butyrivibrio sp. AE3009]|uniref:VanZ family protein n=1 Tax=Butyrivibrio sp. AE3009 TaxID=1280666 RepID=UPI0003B5AA4A|nr:VanZ family protein [Butyrivibrio sp. AE3009]
MSVNDYYSMMVNLISEQIRGIYFSDIILLILVALLCLVIAKAVLMKTGQKVTKSQMILTFCTICYAGVILMITLFRREGGSRSGNISIHLNLGSIRGGWYMVKQAVYSILNVILFVPWGFLLRLKRPGDKQIKAFLMVTITGFLTSFTIEFFQLVTKRGIFEITDLVTNVSGTMIGAVIASIVMAILGIIRRDREK